MMGCHTCGGTVTGPVGTAPERAKESMFTPCVVVPTVEIWRIGPVFPEKKTLYPRVISIPVVSPSSENIALPVAFLTASCSQLPASRPAPCNAPGLPDIVGGWTAERYYNGGAGAVTNGAVKTTWAAGVSDMPAGSFFNMAQYVFNASGSNSTYGASPTVMPASVDLPVCLYLGIPA